MIIEVGFEYLDGRPIYLVPLAHDSQGRPKPRVPKRGGFTAFYARNKKDTAPQRCAIAPTPELETYLKQRSYAFRWGTCRYIPNGPGHLELNIPDIFVKE